MGTPQELDTEQSTIDPRRTTTAANEAEMSAPDFLKGVDIQELDVEVIVL